MAVVTAGCSFAPAQVSDARLGDTSPPNDAAIDAVIDAAPDARACQPGFMAVAGAPSTSRYKIMPQAAYDTAIAACAALDSHLLHLDTQEEANALEIAIDASIAGSSDSGLYRIVGHRPAVTTMTFYELDDTTPLSFTPWGMGEPTMSGGELCIMLRKEGGNAGLPRVVGADQCPTAHEYACECEL